MRSSLLAALLKPVSIERFLQDHFGKRPLLVRGKPGKFDRLLKPAALYTGLDRAREIRCVFGGLKQARIGPGAVQEMYAAGATICVTGIESAHRSLRLAAARIAKEIGYAGRVDFRAYLSPPGSGFDVHFDPRVATTLQLKGSKTWWYCDQPDSPFPVDASPRSDLDRLRRKFHDRKPRKAILRPGDLLCLPPGVWHRAEAGAAGSVALNMAFNHTDATVLDLLLENLRHTLAREPGCREPFFAGPPGKAALAMDSHLDQCFDAVTSALRSMRRKGMTRRLARASRAQRS